MEAFTALGVDVVVTELDVRLNLPPTVATEAQQVVDYYNTVAACVAVPRCVGIVVWDFDGESSYPYRMTAAIRANLFFQTPTPGSRALSQAKATATCSSSPTEPTLLWSGRRLMMVSWRLLPVRRRLSRSLILGRRVVRS